MEASALFAYRHLWVLPGFNWPHYCPLLHGTTGLAVLRQRHCQQVAGCDGQTQRQYGHPCLSRERGCCHGHGPGRARCHCHAPHCYFRACWCESRRHHHCRRRRCWWHWQRCRVRCPRQVHEPCAGWRCYPGFPCCLLPSQLHTAILWVSTACVPSSTPRLLAMEFGSASHRANRKPPSTTVQGQWMGHKGE
jgi:hypothetical protein